MIATITDSASRQTTYTYDATNQYLLQVTTAAGSISYTYGTGNTLTSITSSAGTHQYYTYDSLGRLASSSADGNAQLVTFSYDQPGEVTTTDALGNSSKIFFDYRGLPVKYQDALGNITSAAYDPTTLQVRQITDPTGQTLSYTYDHAGDVTSSTDQLGHSTYYIYGANSRLTSLTDANGNKSIYAYDPSGNLLSTTYANGTSESSTFDPQGNPMSFTNRNGQAISYGYNSAGQVTQQKFSDGTHTDFTYDAHGNLATAVDATGTITLTYNLADQLTRVDYPNGMFLQFTLDAGGRRIKMVDQTGFTVQYTYDAVGRLSGLENGNNATIVTYTYDAAGRLLRKDNANGTYTTYVYDANGNVLHLVNNAPGGINVNSRFDYTYNALGQRTTMATLDGKWTYTYDGTVQLTHAVFASTNSSIPSQDMNYNYDPLGNRTTTVINGNTTAYTTNNVNEYTSVGGVTQSYDSDGNLLSDGTNTYHYDSLDRLISVTTPTGTTTYTYDALGNRSSSTSGGKTTNYLNDPTGMTNVVGEFVATVAVAHNIYGIGLTSRVTGANSKFFDFDALGSTVGTSGVTGSYSSTLNYTPFGKVIYETGDSLPFEFNGEWGVTNESSGLDFMRARSYESENGVFTSQDPLGNVLGAPTSYGFAKNDPAGEIDPMGFTPVHITIYKANKEANDALKRPSFLDGPAENAGEYFGEVAGRILGKKYGSAVGVRLGVIIGEIIFPLGGGVEGGLIGYAIGREYGDEIFGALLGLVGKLIGRWIDEHSKPEQQPGQSPPVTGSPTDRGASAVATAMDPNALSGPSGFGVLNFIQKAPTLPYRIDFENAKTATAPAQDVTIANQLPSTLDWSTFRVTEVAFGDTIISIPSNSQHYQTTVSMTYNGKTFDVLVEVGIHLTTGQVYATFQSIDPNTELPPDVLTGFLPPEDGTGRGQGHVSYTVQAKAGLATGTAIRDVALITFDQNNVIATNQKSETDPSQGTDPTKEALVTIDAGSPTSTVTPLPAISNASFTLSWNGHDDPGGSGIASYTIYDSDNGAPYTPFLQGTTATSATFTGTAGHQYSFYTVAIDNVGQQEAIPASADATTTIGAAPTITNNPASQSIVSGQKATLTAAASGYPIPTVQWQVSTNGGNTFAAIAGATSTTYSFVATAAQNGNEYEAVFTNSQGHVTTTPATLTLLTTPTITNNPTSQSVSLGQKVTLSATANGNPPPTVQWQVSTDAGKTFNNISGATSNIYSFAVAAAQNGNKYQAVFTNSQGHSTTTPATLTVLISPTITTNPTSQSIPSGQTVTLTAAAGGNPTPTVQWQVSTNGGTSFAAIPGATSMTYSFAVTAAQNGNKYQAVFTNSQGHVTTTPATLTILTSPTITTNPTSQSIASGLTVTFSAAAIGNPAPTVQWQVSTDNGKTYVNIAGATSTTYSFTVTAVQKGNKYQAVFTNSLGRATTTPALLTIS